MAFTVKDVLRLEVAPALGCTEPVAIALASAAAASLLPGNDLESLNVWVDPNIYKNGMAVTIPGTGGLCGLDTAAALGFVAGDASLGLEVMEPVDGGAVRRAEALLDAGRISVDLLPDRQGLYIKARAEAGGHVAEAVIQGTHDNITSLVLDGDPMDDSPLLARARAGSGQGLAELEEWLKGLTLQELLELLDGLDEDDFAFLREGVEVNMRLARHGLKHGSGLGVGKTLDRLMRQRLLGRDMIQTARVLTSAAADARMGGVKLPAMSSAGSGNHGLTAVLPIQAVREFVDCSEEEALTATALSHLVTAYVKAYTGRLSAVCGCSVAAGAGAAAGVAHLLGGTLAHIAAAITNLTMDLAGVICDGAKNSCALKLSTAGGTAVQAALFALQGVGVRDTDGIMGASPEQTMQNIGTLSCEGMIETDRTILAIMLKKRFTGLDDGGIS